MYLVSIFENGKPSNFQTVDNLNDLYRGLCTGLDVSKFNAMSNFNLFFGETNLSTLEKEFSEDSLDTSFAFDIWDCTCENLADSVYEYMRDHLNVYYDIVKQIDEFKEKIINYNLTNK